MEILITCASSNMGASLMQEFRFQSSKCFLMQTPLKGSVLSNQDPILMASFNCNYLFKGSIFKFSHTEGKDLNTGTLGRRSSVVTTSICITSHSF